MLHLLAQLPPPPDGLEAWLRNFFWLVGGVAACVILFRQLRGVTDRQITEVHGRIKRERAEIDASIAELKREDAALRVKLDQEIDELQERIDAVPHRVITLLRETKGLIG